MRSRQHLVVAIVATLVVPVACGSSGGGTPDPAAADVTAPPDALDPNAPEIVEPGDIPDDQVFVTYTWPDGSFSVDVPEGWSRDEADGTVTFTDKYNTIAISSLAAPTAPSVEAVRSSGLADVTSDPTFHLVDVQPVTRRSGDGVLATYEIGSEPNSVTGKSALLSVERFVFFDDGNEVVLTLSGAKGADNVDPWRIVSDSLVWN